MLMPSQVPSGLPQGSPAASWPGVSNPPRPQQPSVAAAPPAQRPVIRAQMGDELKPPPARPALVSLPSPEQLGVSKPAPADGGADWVDARRRLRALGAVSFQMLNATPDRCCFVCLLPTDQANYNHRVEAEASTEAEAVRLGLERAETWARRR